jgi:dihydrofolate reductase
MALIPIALIVARARNNVIGAKGGIPWRLKTDLVNFKAVTLFKPVIMGRATWDSLPFKPLPGRLNIVLSRDGSFEPKGALPTERLEEAVGIAREQAEDDGADEICVIGGAQIYASMLPRAKRLYITEVDVEVEGDTLFPEFDESQWREDSRQAHPAGPDDQFAFTFRVLNRI